jgi:hypothetical protein
MHNRPVYRVMFRNHSAPARVLPAPRPEIINQNIHASRNDGGH